MLKPPDQYRPAFPQDDVPLTSALTELKQMAEQGDVEAQYLLGALYTHEEGIPQDYKDAIPQDYQEAVRWLRLAAEQGNVESQYFLGGMYKDGEGVPQNYQEAIRLYRLAADQGYAKAQNNLGRMYFLGEGVPQDYVLAHMFANLVASQQKGDWRQKTLEAMDMLEKRMTREQIAEAQRLAREWKPKRSGSQ